MKAQYDTIVSQGKTWSFPKGLLQSMPAYSAVYNDYLNQHQCSIIWDSAPFKIVQGVRQSGKTRTIVGLALLNAIMCMDKTILVTSHKKQMSYHINEDIRNLYNTIPEPKPKLTVCNHDRIEFDNGSRIVTDIASCCAGRGMGIDLLLMDEAAFYNEKEVKSFWDSNFPILRCRKDTQVVILSTRKNRSKKTNFFWRMWLGAVEGTNDFKPFKISKKDCPHRDAKWTKEMKNILGRAAYDREHTIRTK